MRALLMGGLLALSVLVIAQGSQQPSAEEGRLLALETRVYSAHHLGVYLNLVEGLLWVQDVVRSNRTTPTKLSSARQRQTLPRECARPSAPKQPRRRDEGVTTRA